MIFRGSLYHHSKWKGEPRPELDEAWRQVGQGKFICTQRKCLHALNAECITFVVGAMSITEEQVRRLGKDPDYVVKWPDSLGGGHVASVEVFHHLHCLVRYSLLVWRSHCIC